MANFRLDVECDTHFYGTHFARWKHHMLDHFRAMGSKEWWIIVVGFSCDALDKRNLTQAQKDCLQLDTCAQYYLTCALHEDIFRRVWDLDSAHDMWMHSKPSSVTPPQVMMESSRRRMITRRRCMSVSSLTTIW